jgi:hypothetical protein
VGGLLAGEAVDSTMSELDPLGRTPLAAGMKAQIDAALSEIPEGKRGAVVILFDEHGARAHLAARIKGTWKVAAGAGVPLKDGKPSGWVAVAGSW